MPDATHDSSSLETAAAAAEYDRSAAVVLVWHGPLTPVVEATRERFQTAFTAAPCDAEPAYRSWLAARHGAQDPQCTNAGRQDGLTTSQRRLRQTFEMQGGEKL